MLTVLTAVLATLLTLGGCVLLGVGVGDLRRDRPPTFGSDADEVLLVGAGAVLVGVFVLTVLTVAA